MAVHDISRTGVESALEEFHRVGLGAMLEEYHGGRSRDWYAEVGNWVYDQKLLVRAAHVHQGLGYLPPRGPGRFNARQATTRLKSLDYRIVGRREATDANLQGPKATEPLMQWLIGAASQRTTFTDGEAASRLEYECGSEPIAPRTRMDASVAAMQRAIRARDPEAPLLLVLLVRSDTGEPGAGAREFLADRFPDEPLLREPDARDAHPELWSRVVARASREVYGYRGWEVRYANLHGEYVADPAFTPPPVEGGGTPRGGAGEGPNHRALRLGVLGNPGQINPRFRDAEAVTEKELLSGDRVDVVYVARSEILAMEVKSRDSNRNDLVRGLYQCVKYRAVLKAHPRAIGRAYASHPRSRIRRGLGAPPCARASGDAPSGGDPFPSNRRSAPGSVDRLERGRHSSARHLEDGRERDRDEPRGAVSGACQASQGRPSASRYRSRTVA